MAVVLARLCRSLIGGGYATSLRSEGTLRELNRLVSEMFMTGKQFKSHLAQGCQRNAEGGDRSRSALRDLSVTGAGFPADHGISGPADLRLGESARVHQLWYRSVAQFHCS